MNHIADLCAFLDASPVNFWAVNTARTLLENEGFRQLDMADEWTLVPGDKYYVIQNGSAIFAFIVGDTAIRPASASSPGRKCHAKEVP